MMSNRPPIHRPTGFDYDAGRKDDPHWRFIRSARWQRFRRWFLARHPLCAECERTGRATPATDVDHITRRRERPDLALDESNCQALCKPCHARKTRSESRGTGGGSNF